MNPSHPWPVHTYLTLVVTFGIGVLAEAILHWRCEDPKRFAVYLILACLAGALKVRLPGMMGTYSLTFLFVLIGVVELTFSETILITASSMVVQCGWRPAVRPSTIQIAFNAGATSIGAAAAYAAARSFGANYFVAQLFLAAVVYFVVNTFLVSCVLAQTEHRDLREIWSEWFRLSLTYYLTGVGVAGIMIVSGHHFGWTFSLMALPLMYIEYLCYRFKIYS